MDIVEVRVGAGPTGEMFMDSRQEVSKNALCLNPSIAT